MAVVAACGSYARLEPTCPARSPRPRPRRRRRSATAPSSWSPTSSAAATSRSRSSARSVYGERDCSLQRRHQKVVEEAPAPGLPDEVRAALHDAARKAAEAVDYRGAGTVEFLYDPATERFWFLEMNTRLQVEHPVTEAGARRRPGRAPARRGRGTELHTMGWHRPPRGHAIEVRLYAEDPAADYQPQSGTLTLFDIPVEDGIRVDAGYESGSAVSTHYDAMLAKVIAHAPTPRAGRAQAGRRPRAGAHPRRADQPRPAGRRPARRALPARARSPPTSSRWSSRSRTGRVGAAHAAAIALAERAGEARTVQRGIPVACRNVVSQPQVTEFEDGTRVEWWGGRDGYRLDGAAVVSASPTEVDPRAGRGAHDLRGHGGR